MRRFQDKIDENIKDDDAFAVLEFSKQSSKRKRRLKSVALLLFNLLVIAIIIVVEFTSNHERVDITTVLKTWGENWYFMLALFGLVTLYFLGMTARMSLLIRATTGRPRRKLSFSTAVLGKYYDFITPFGSGGQPFQMFNLGRKLDVGLSTSIPLADYIVHQLVFSVMAIVVFIINPEVMGGNTLLIVAAYIGIVVFAGIPLAVIVLSIFPKAIQVPLKFLCRIGHKIRLIKNLEKAEAKVINGVERYAGSMKALSSKWRYLVISALLSVMCWIAYHALPYFVLRVCGVTANFYDTVCMSIFIFAAIVVVPTPGGAGAAEGAFYAIFQSLTGGFLFWGTMLWRFCIYYIVLILGLSITVYQYIHASRKEKRAAALAINKYATHTEAGESVTDDDVSET
ncbi:MAG: flippase-like domain-containing protein [Clostridiales bacterium]|nr:flippase-like domain-containing protein [Clostridiales bacterium]